MRKHICILTVLMLLLAVLPSAAQTRNVKLTITVTTGTGDDLTGQPITLTHTDYSLSYGTLTLDASGSCSVKVYAGNHRLTIDRDGYELLTKDFTIEEGTTETNVMASLFHGTRKLQLSTMISRVMMPLPSTLVNGRVSTATWKLPLRS